MLRADTLVTLKQAGSYVEAVPRSLSELGFQRQAVTDHRPPLTRDDVDHLLDVFFRVAGTSAAGLASAELAALGVTVSTMRSELMPEVAARLAKRLGGDAERSLFWSLLDPPRARH